MKWRCGSYDDTTLSSILTVNYYILPFSTILKIEFKYYYTLVPETELSDRAREGSHSLIISSNFWRGLIV